MDRLSRAVLAGLAALGVVHGQATAQPFEQAGVRALGMGGAFVAVADDASAVWWNPAGLANGPFFNLIVEHQDRRRQPSDDVLRLGRSAVDQTLNGFAIATPPLGLSYYRTRSTFIPAAGAGTGRDTLRSGDVRVATLIAHQTAVTLLHSLTPAFVAGATLKFVRGIAATGTSARRDTDAVLDTAEDLVGKGTNRFDADLGVHLKAGPFRAGVTVRNVTEPSFAAPDGQQLSLQRQARAGIAWVFGRDTTTLAADLDLTRQEEDTAGRRLAIGVEQRWGERFAARGGFRVNTSEAGDGSVSVGGSVAVRTGLWVDGFWSRGQDDDGRWGLAGRLTY